MRAIGGARRGQPRSRRTDSAIHPTTGKRSPASCRVSSSLSGSGHKTGHEPEVVEQCRQAERNRSRSSLQGLSWSTLALGLPGRVMTARCAPSSPTPATLPRPLPSIVSRLAAQDKMGREPADQSAVAFVEAARWASFPLGMVQRLAEGHDKIGTTALEAGHGGTGTGVS